MFIYNTSLTMFFWTLFNLILTEFNTLHAFSNLSYNSYYVLLLTTLLLSMAGVPPFIGFFSNLFIIVLLVNNSFFLLYSLLFIVLFLGLYFYVQNLRFLHSTNANTLNYPYVVVESHLPLYYYFTIFTLLVIISGSVYIDDFILFFSWIFY